MENAFLPLQLNTPFSDVQRQLHDILSQTCPSPPISALPLPSSSLPVSQTLKPPIPPRHSHEAHKIVLRKLLLEIQCLFNCRLFFLI